MKEERQFEKVKDRHNLCRTKRGINGRRKEEYI
jgi:hypothetical protein